MTQAPLTPEDCDLRSFPYMPLDVARLRNSDLAAVESPEACWAAVRVWTASWHQVPAASLPDDDRVLSNLSGYGRVVTEWLRVKEGALRGWIKCSDGRLYHPVVAEKARESWATKQQYAYRKFVDRLRKDNKKREEGQLPLFDIPTLEDWMSSGIPSDKSEVPSENKPIPLESSTDSSGIDPVSAGIPTENALNRTKHNRTKDKDFLSSSQSTHTVLGEKSFEDDCNAAVQDLFMREETAGSVDPEPIPAVKIDTQAAMPEVPCEVWQWRVTAVKAGFPVKNAGSPKAMVQYRSWIASRTSLRQFDDALLQAKSVVGMPTSPLYLTAIMRQQKTKPSAKGGFTQGKQHERAPAVRSIFGSFEGGRYERTVSAECTMFN